MAQSGACCLIDGSCVDVFDIIDCDIAGGDFFGGFSCFDNPCGGGGGGACCLPTGTCVPAADDFGCFLQGGEFLPGVSCDASPCSVAFGACCLPTGDCLDTDEFQCVIQNGLFFPNLPCGDPAVTCTTNPPPNDDCFNAEFLFGEGFFFYDNTAAATDGPPDPACFNFGTDQVDNDVWFCWTPSSTGTATVETCGLTGFDTKIAAYDGCACPPGPLLACNDDDCGVQSRISFSVVAGHQYLLRVGAFPGSTPGAGEFLITIGPAPCPCELDGAAGVNVFDLLAYLALWFPMDPAADLNGVGGVDVFDLLEFLSCWFPASAGAPCP